MTGGGGYFQFIAVYTFGGFKAEEPVCTMRVLECFFNLMRTSIISFRILLLLPSPYVQTYPLNLPFANIIVCLFVIKPTRCTNFTNLFCHETLHVSESSILVLLESCLQTCMTCTIVECTVNKILMTD